jgi:hypothetical protein
MKIVWGVTSIAALGALVLGWFVSSASPQNPTPARSSNSSTRDKNLTALVEPILNKWLNQQEGCLRIIDTHQGRLGVSRRRLQRLAASARFFYGGTNRLPGGIAPSIPIGNRSSFSVFGVGDDNEKISDSCHGADNSVVIAAFTLPNANFLVPNAQMDIVVLCDYFFEESKDEQAGTLIHELLHLMLPRSVDHHTEMRKMFGLPLPETKEDAALSHDITESLAKGCK